jgi:hypothetical protein
MRALATAALVLALASCGEPATQPLAAGVTASFARGDNPRAPLAVYTTQLRADNERPNATESQAWGFAQVKVKPGGVIEWTVRVHNPAGEEFRAGHIHVITNPDGTGPVAQGILSGVYTDTKFEVSGSATNPALAAALLDDPENYYINLHTAAYPAGAILGDLP